MSPFGLLQKLRDKVAAPGFRFNRPLVLLQSDDWGRVGVRDADGREELRASGLEIGERPYDLYSLETADDVRELAGVLRSLQDSAGQAPCLEMNFAVANVDFAASAASGFREIPLKPLSDGLPGRWSRPGLIESYREGIQHRVFLPALHGTTHFCQPAVRRALTSDGERAAMLRTLWQSETPYIHWRMPWVGYEYWDPEQAPEERFLAEVDQEQGIGCAARCFRKVFNEAAMSACAPGYRANSSTHRAWKAHGIRAAQNGPGTKRAPHFDSQGLLHTYRSLDFEPALNPALRWKDSVKAAQTWLGRGLPFVISVHSINFHSSLAPYRQKTLPMLRELLQALQSAYPDLLYVNTRDVLEIVETGSYQTSRGRVAVVVSGAREAVKL